jgi:hypothetical protein
MKIRCTYYREEAPCPNEPILYFISVTGIHIARCSEHNFEMTGEYLGDISGHRKKPVTREEFIISQVMTR